MQTKSQSEQEIKLPQLSKKFTSVYFWRDLSSGKKVLQEFNFADEKILVFAGIQFCGLEISDKFVKMYCFLDFFFHKVIDIERFAAHLCFNS